MAIRKWGTIRRPAVLLALLLLFVLLLPAGGMQAAAQAGVSLRTTLTDGMIQKGSRRTFDVWARSATGEKIDASVTLNGEPVAYTWDDTDKTSYTLHFTREGRNTVVVAAGAGEQKVSLTYHVTYQKAEKGEIIGQAVWSVELFTIGSDYLVEPVYQDIREGESSADALLRLLHEQGYVAYYTGTPSSGFYLAYIGDGDKTNKRYNGAVNSQSMYGSPASPRKLNVSSAIPSFLRPLLEKTMNYFYARDYEENSEGYLGEFVYTNGSGWMYSVNHVFPNVSFADTYLSDGDVVRVQFTLAYGADIGGASAIGGSLPGGGQTPSAYYGVADKDALTAQIAAARTSGRMGEAAVSAAYKEAVRAAATLNAGQGAVDQAAAELAAALQSSAGKTTNSPAAAGHTGTAGGSRPTSPTIGGSASGNGGGSFAVPTASYSPGEETLAEDPAAPVGTGTQPGRRSSPQAAAGGAGETPSAQAPIPGSSVSAGGPTAGGESSPQPGSTAGEASPGEDTAGTGPRGWTVLIVSAALLAAAGGTGGFLYIRKRRYTPKGEETPWEGKEPSEEGEPPHDGMDSDGPEPF